MVADVKRRAAALAICKSSGWEFAGGDILESTDPRVMGFVATADAVLAAVEAACAPQDDVATALRELLDAYSFYFPPGNPWGDKARKALGIETPSAPEGHDPTNPFAPRERPQKSVRLMTDAERRAAGLDPNGGFDGPTGAD